MPTKPKLPRNKVPPPKLSQPLESNSSNLTVPQRTASGLDQEAEDQFELELCWCIQQLEAGLLDLKLQDKQVYNMTKSLHVLKSSNASLIKKRQVMRNTFGDYRSKMVEDEKKFGRTTSIVKFTSNNKKQEKKSVFFKKACNSSSIKKEIKTDCNHQLDNTKLINPDVSNEPFKFNFSLDQS